MHDPTVIQRLVNAKYQHTLGRNELAKRTESGAGEAVKDFHDALETFMMTILDVVTVAGGKTRWMPFHEYPAAIEKQTGKPFAQTSVVTEVNDLRVPYKHRGVLPNPAAVR